MTPDDWELRLLRWLGQRVPNLPRASGLINRVLKPLYLRLSRSPVEVEVLGVMMQLVPTEAVDGWLLLGPQLYDPAERRFLGASWRPGRVFVDVGSYIGFYALLAARSVGPTGRVIAIEAWPPTLERLRYNVRLNAFQHVHVVACGVSDRVESVPMVVACDGNAGGSALLPGGVGTAALEVGCAPLLDVLVDADCGRIDAMKLDIEGMEARALGAFLEDAPDSMLPERIVYEWKLLAGVDRGNLHMALRRRGYVRGLLTGYNEGWTLQEKRR